MIYERTDSILLGSKNGLPTELNYQHDFLTGSFVEILKLSLGCPETLSFCFMEGLELGGRRRPEAFSKDCIGAKASPTTECDKTHVVRGEK